MEWVFLLGVPTLFLLVAAWMVRTGVTFPALTAWTAWKWLGRRFHWAPVEPIKLGVTTVSVIAIGVFGAITVLYLISMLNWAPLWGRLYAACMAQQPEPNTVAEIIQHRAICAKHATSTIEKPQ